MTNTLQTNTFVGGMNFDSDISIIPNDQYRYAENVRIITDKEGTSGVLQNIQDVRMIEGGDFLSVDEIILSAITIDKYGVVITVDDNDINRIYRVDNYNNPPLKSTIVLRGKLDIHKDSNIKIVANYESDTNIKIYIVDSKSPIKSLNIMSDKYIYKPGTSGGIFDDNGNIKDPSVIEATPSAILPMPQILGLGTGNLKSGKVQYCYQLYNIRGNSTVFSSCSGLVHLTKSNTEEELNKYSGTGKDEPSGKSVKISIEITNSTSGINYSYYYDGCRIYRIFYKDNTDIPTIDIVDEIMINQDTTVIQYEDLGSNKIGQITIEELNAIQNYSFIPSTIEKKNNMLFAAGVQQNEWDPEYDARAYRCTSTGRLILNSSNYSKKIDIQLPEPGTIEEKQIYTGIDIKHDCINPYNSVRGNVNSENDCQYSNNKVNGNRVLGGKGPNVSYRFVTTVSVLDTMGTMGRSGIFNREDDYAKIYVPSSTQDKILFNHIDTPTTIIQHKTDIYKSQPNYADPIFDVNYVGYQRDEIYRFGIVLYNNKGIASPVHWIGDIRMPHPNKYCAFYADNNLLGNALGLQFTVTNLPEEVVAYEIVRCKRTAQDRTVVMQGVLSEITNYDKKYLNGDQLANELDYRPRVPLGYTNTNIPWAYTKSVLGITSIQDRQFFINSKVNRDYAVLISPEIDINKENILSQMDNVYVEPIYWLHGQTNYRVKGLNNSPFIVPLQTNQAFTSIKAIQSGFIGQYITSTSEPVFCLCNEGDGGSVHDPSNLINKHYTPHYTSLYNNRISVSLNNNTIYPPILAKDAIVNMNAYYRTIGNISYLNIGFVCNDTDNWNIATNRSGYFGSCCIINGQLSSIPRLSAIDTTKVEASSTVINNIKTSVPAVFELPVVNIKRYITPYGGNSYVTRSNSVYISTGSYHQVKQNNSVIVYGGDTYLGIHDHRTCCPWPNPGGYNESMGALQISCTDYIPFESSINLTLQYGDTTSRSTEGNITWTNPYLGTTIDQGNQGNYQIQSKPYYAYNDAYSAQSDSKKYVSKGVYSITNENNINRIVYSQVKTSNEIDDNWLKFKLADYLDVDSQYGSITNMLSFRDKLFFWQNNSLGIAAVNDRSLITDNNVGTLTLGTGGVLTRYDYITTGNGSSIINDYSIINSYSTIYWYDTDKNEICSFSDTVHKLSKEKNIQTFLNSNSNLKVNTALYDYKFNELQMCFNKGNIVFNEYTQSFTSFYTYMPDKHLNYSNKLLYIKNNIITNNDDFALNKMQSKLEYVVNKDPLITKTFDNIFFGGVFSDIKAMLIDATFNTKTQSGSIFQDYLNGGYAIDYREDTYRFAIGREDNKEDDMSYPGRLKGKYLICNYTINCDNQHNFNLPNINTTYRYSLI